MSYLNIVLFLVYLCFYKDFSSLGVQAGSLFKNKYRMKLISIEECELPPGKWDWPHRINFTCVARKISRKTTVIDANYTIVPGTPRLIFTMRGYELQKNSAKNLVFKVENITCGNTVVYKILNMAGLQMTPDCEPAAGNFSMPTVNFDDFSFMMTSIALSGPGRYGFEFQSFNKNGYLTCVLMTCELVLNNKVKK